MPNTAEHFKKAALRLVYLALAPNKLVKQARKCEQVFKRQVLFLQ